MVYFDWLKPVKDDASFTSDQDEMVETKATECQNFILGGIRAVKHAPSTTHAHIIADMAKALNCCDEALSFLLRTNPETQNSELDFPDAERRRKIASDNQLSIAE